MGILLKIKSKVVCTINDIEYQFNDGISAYQELHRKYKIISLSEKSNIICIELTPINKNVTWKQEYVEQFGKEPIFFLYGRGR